MSDFYSKLQETEQNVSVTENGAVGYKTTRHSILDFNFLISSYRNDLSKAVTDFRKILSENEPYALKFLFYVRDAREGVGERELFRTCLTELVNSKVVNVDSIIDTIIKETPQFGRWDDLFVLVGTKYENKMFEAVKEQLSKDCTYMTVGKPISLLAKWLPSENASSPKTKELAHIFREKVFNATSKDYRKTLSTLRKYLDVTERKTCAKEWSEIDYNTVPSKANLKYKEAFLRNDETRRREFLSKLASGDKTVKINSTVNFPHDIVHKYYDGQSYWNWRLNSYDETLEQLWKNLKETEGLEDTIVVRDDSGSMTSTVGNGSLTALQVATALGVYCGQHCKSSYKNKIITFSQTPRYLDFSDPQKFGSLHSILKFLDEHNEVANTNVKGVFDLILKTAVQNKLSKEDMPKQILIISDMEFDSATSSYHYHSNVDMALFSTISAEYSKYGYSLPKLVFWNVCSRTGTIPVTQNEAGVILMSGFSQNVLKMLESGKTDPYEVLIDLLNKERYERIPLVEYK